MITQNHPFHLVQKRPWPIFSSFRALFIVIGLTKWFYSSSFTLVIFRLISLFLTSYQWWRDVSREGSFQGEHSILVYKGLKIGIILFIVSEVIFFFSFFWAFFQRRLRPTIDLGLVWPPTSIQPFNPLEIPLLNTLILLRSGVLVTWSHHSLVEGDFSSSIKSIILTIILALYFTLLQGVEYKQATFTISDSAYGSTFFVATGFHGLHVIIGTIFLLVSLYRLRKGLISSRHHLGTEASIWYWHFVDVVWLFLYVWIYYWGYII